MIINMDSPDATAKVGLPLRLRTPFHGVVRSAEEKGGGTEPPEDNGGGTEVPRRDRYLQYL